MYAIAGRYAYGNAGTNAARWDLTAGTVTLLGEVGDFGARDGAADGSALLPALPGRGDHATELVSTDGRPDTVAGPHGEPVLAVAISADGRTIAGMIVEGDTGRPAVWHCR